MDDNELWTLYRQVVFRLIDKLPQAIHFMIITADYPQGKVLNRRLREQRELQLYQTLKHYGQPHRLYGCSEDLKHCELSFATANLTLSVALKIARDYKQNAIYEVHNKQLYLHTCLMSYRPTAKLGTFLKHIVSD